jgi:16S rRNA U1498 N3-methylase RsmE
MEEIVLSRGRGAVTVSLGRRNLRSETAAVAAVAQVMAAVEA